ncbi:MAG: CoA transferase [Novosphingobium sp.]|nr:CoA transferase [Novosphingobium sp.]
MTGLLAGIRVVEFQGIGPGPFCGMMLADHGADVIRIERPDTRYDPNDALARSRRSIAIDMKQPEGVALVRRLCASADAIIEGYRPGVMERFGLGPDVLLGDNPRLVYGRITGWGQDGPIAQRAGHDINYLAVSGVLSTIGRAGENPVPPGNYIADFGGGGMMLAFGLIAAILRVKMGGKGQVVDAAMMEGASLLAGLTWQLYSGGYWNDANGTNWLDGGAHFYDTYRCADGKFVAVGAIEAPFYALLRERLGLTDDRAFDAQMDYAAWPALKVRLAEVFATRTRDEWCKLFEDVDACVSPVMSLGEAPSHPQNVARGNFVEVLPGAMQPAPAPRFSGNAAAAPRPARRPGADSDAILREIGLDDEEAALLRETGVVKVPDEGADDLLTMMGASKRR